MNFSIFDQIINIIENGISTDEDREILGSSLFYYCCGIDPTPIAAFGSKYKLYIYSDILIYGRGFFTETKTLCERICDLGYNMQCNKVLNPNARWGKNTNMLLSKFIDTNDNSFYLLFIQADAYKTFQNIYDDEQAINTILPNCICNYRYEFYEEQPYDHFNHYDYFSHVEKRTDFILGYCFDEKKYRHIADYDYRGDYDEKGTKVKLYKRRYWYLH